MKHKTIHMGVVDVTRESGRSDLKEYIIWGNHVQTRKLIKTLRMRDDGVITVIDEHVKGLRVMKDYVIADSGYVDELQGNDVELVHYQYVMDKQAWLYLASRKCMIWQLKM